MSDDLGKKIKQITDMLSQENMPDNLKGILSLLGGSSTSSSEEPSLESSGKEEKPARSDMDDNIEMIRKVKKIMDRVNSTSDPRVNLLIAVKPFLNNQRQKKLNNCVRILQMSSMTRLLDDEKESL